MAYQANAVIISSFIANENCAGKQYHGVILDTGNAGQIKLAGNANNAAAGSHLIGILQNAPRAGETAKVAVLTPGSILKVKLGTANPHAIVIGDYLSPNGTSGSFVEGAQYERVSLRALENSAVNSTVISAIAIPERILP